MSGQIQYVNGADMSLKKNDYSLEDARYVEVIPDVDQEVNTAITRVAVCLCLDVSGSMECNNRIGKLREGLNHFKRDLMEDVHAYKAADLAIVTFNDTAEVVLPFTPMEKVNMPYLTADGSTELGEGVLLALAQLEERKNYYKQNCISYSRPMLFIMSDGYDNGSQRKRAEAKKLIREYTQSKKVTAFGINVDDNSAIDELTDLTGTPAQKLDSRNYAKFFEWLSNSVSAKSSATSDVVQLPPINWVG